MRQKHRTMRRVYFFGCVLALALLSSASEEEYNSCIGTRFAAVADASELLRETIMSPGTPCAIMEVLDEVFVRRTYVFSGFGTHKATKKCCGIDYLKNPDYFDHDEEFTAQEGVLVFNNLKFKDDVDELEIAINDDSSCDGQLEPGSAPQCGETCALAYREEVPKDADGFPDFQRSDFQFCEGKINVTTDLDGAVSSFKCEKFAGREDVLFAGDDGTGDGNESGEEVTEDGEDRAGSEDGEKEDAEVSEESGESGEAGGDSDLEDAEERAGNGDDGESSQCFPSAATVQLRSGTVKKMSELVVGDVVRVSAREYSPVFMFTHKDAHVANSFVELRTASGHQLAATPGHFVYINGDLAPTHTIRVGDYVTLDTGGDSEVIEVSRAKHSGLYNPQTIQGDLVVNGVVSSTYTTALEPAVAHGILAPLRGAYRLFVTFIRAYESSLAMRTEVGFL